MADILKLYCTIQDYKKIATILLSYDKHISLLHNNFIIASNEKYNYYVILENITREINKEYNLIISKTVNQTEDYQLKNNNCKITYSLYKINRIFNSNNDNQFKDYNRFFSKSVNNIINNISIHIGFPSLKTLIYLIYGGSYKHVCDTATKEQIKYFNKMFIILKYSVVEHDSNNNLQLKIMKIQ